MLSDHRMWPSISRTYPNKLIFSVGSWRWWFWRFCLIEHKTLHVLELEIGLRGNISKQCATVIKLRNEVKKLNVSRQEGRFSWFTVLRLLRKTRETHKIFKTIGENETFPVCVKTLFDHETVVSDGRSKWQRCSANSHFGIGLWRCVGEGNELWECFSTTVPISLHLWVPNEWIANTLDIISRSPPKAHLVKIY